MDGQDDDQRRANIMSALLRLGGWRLWIVALVVSAIRYGCGKGTVIGGGT